MIKYPEYAIDAAEQIDEYFKSRGANSRIDFAFEQHTTASHLISMPISLAAEFYSSHRFSQFAQDIRRINELDNEEYLRSKNPTLAAAYEEYQILLKLAK